MCEEKERQIGLIYTPENEEAKPFLETFRVGDKHPEFNAVLIEIVYLKPRKLDK